MMEVLTAVELRFELTHWTQLGLNPSLDLSATDITAAEESRERERERERDRERERGRERR